MKLIKLEWQILLVVSMMGLFAVTPILAGNQSDNINKEEASAILQELKQIRTVLERIEKKTGNTQIAAAPAQPKTTQISTINRPTLGDKNAPVTIVEVSDYQCPFCKRFVDMNMPAIKKELIDTGKIRFVFKDLPLPFHDKAKIAAQAAHCAGDQGKYWPMHDKLFANVKQYNKTTFMKHAKILHLDEKVFKTCINSKQHIKAIEKDIADANKAGLNGTPSFVIGKTTRDIIKGDILVGAQPLSSLKQYIKKYL